MANITMKRVGAAAAATAAALALGVGGATSAVAKIEPVCHNNGGQEPQGNCNGGGLSTTNENPAGHAPPGQN
ncbi:hypothetical protein AB0M28_00840 [Streptomyces sp. NPDC051940]|uniref:hypothetical protein n=1 Tax=Streptomyces sp. NPDC051940 TaxID=3155675 RepID=UPI003442CE67